MSAFQYLNNIISGGTTLRNTKVQALCPIWNLYSSCFSMLSFSSSRNSEVAEVKNSISSAERLTGVKLSNCLWIAAIRTHHTSKPPRLLSCLTLWHLIGHFHSRQVSKCPPWFKHIHTYTFTNERFLDLMFWHIWCVWKLIDLCWNISLAAQHVDDNNGQTDTSTGWNLMVLNVKPDHLQTTMFLSSLTELDVQVSRAVNNLLHNWRMSSVMETEPESDPGPDILRLPAFFFFFCFLLQCGAAAWSMAVTKAEECWDWLQ